MSEVIKFPEIIKLDPNRFHRQRLFYVGRVFKGPSYSCNYEDYYLRRNEKVRGNKGWSLKIFGLKKNIKMEINLGNILDFLFCIQSQVTDIWAKLNNPNAKLPVRWELIAGFVIMVTERLVRLASKLEESEHEQADRECFDGLLLGDGDADFPGLLGLLSFGVPKDVEEQQVQMVLVEDLNLMERQEVQEV